MLNLTFTCANTFTVSPDATFTFKNDACCSSKMEFGHCVFNFSKKSASIAFAHGPVSMSAFQRISFSSINGIYIKFSPSAEILILSAFDFVSSDSD